jgi:hypothetical protein
VIVQLSLLIFLLLVSGLGPGMLITRSMRLPPLLRFCSAIGLSGIIIYLFATAIYLTGIHWQWCYACTLIFIIIFLFELPDITRLLRNHAVRRTVIGFFILAFWTFILLSLIRIYSGGLWAGDWAEHYDRTEFFLHRGPINYRFLDLYTLPARPPMMNLLAAFFLAQVGKGFEAFELCFAIINLTSFLTCSLLLNHFWRRGQRGFWYLVIALMSSPFFAENLTYTWTKLFSAFYVLLAIALYLRGRRVLAFLMLAAGCLVHYSAAPLALFIGLHYLWQWLRNRSSSWREAIHIFIVSAALLGTWFSWSIYRYGLGGTIASTTTISGSQKLSAAANINKIALNIYYALIPPPVGRLHIVYRDQSTLGYVRDAAFYCYQQNVFLMIGSVAAIIAMWIFWRQIGNRKSWFWIGLILFCIPVGLATVGDLEPFSAAHAVVQPITLIAISAVAALVPSMPRWILQWLIAGWALDFALGVYLQVYLENFTFTKVTSLGGTELFAAMPIKLAGVAAQCLHGKTSFHIQFIGDHFGDYAGPILWVLVIGEIIALWIAMNYRSRLVHASGRRRARLRKLS